MENGGGEINNTAASTTLTITLPVAMPAPLAAVAEHESLHIEHIEYNGRKQANEDSARMAHVGGRAVSAWAGVSVVRIC